uniref:Uncharacterized protein n=1 Tax=Chelydra serpentina TaxID=8475 RepID=A0A8C3SHL8_CHESE
MGEGQGSNLSGLSGRSWRLSPCLTLFRSSDRTRSGFAVSGSRVTATGERPPPAPLAAPPISSNISLRNSLTSLTISLTFKSTGIN